MPDIPDRDEREAELAKLLSKWLKQQNKLMLELTLGSNNYQELLNKLPPEFWDEIGAEGAAMLRPFMSRNALDAAERLLDTITVGVDWALVNEAAVNWARQYTFELVTGINGTTRQSLQKLIPGYFEEAMTQGELRERLGNLYSPVRAEMIARTEVTRAAVEGERSTVAELEKQGIKMIEVWQTRNDEIVCVICGPRHGKKEGDGWTKNDGPPAHPRCRCWVTHVSSVTGDIGQVYEPYPGLGGIPKFNNIADANSWAIMNGLPISHDIDSIIQRQYEMLSETERTMTTREQFFENWRKHYEPASDKYILQAYNDYIKLINDGKINNDVFIAIRKPSLFLNETDLMAGIYNGDLKTINLLDDGLGLWEKEKFDLIRKRYISNVTDAFDNIEGTIIHEYGHKWINYPYLMI